MTTEAKCPIDHIAGRGRSNKDWWPNALHVDLLNQHSSRSNPMGEGLQLREGVQEHRLQGSEEGPRGSDDRLEALVAGGLRSLRAVDDSHGLARRGHVPDRRRPWRWRQGPAALRAAQQLAGQRQPGQGASSALAGEAEVRPQDLLVGSDDPRRQRGPGDDGLQDLRLRWRSRGRLGAGQRRQLGRRDGMAGGQAVLGSAGPRGPLRRRADGSDLRQSGRSERQSGSGQGGRRHPRDLPPHGDERRGDGGADRRRPHLRQDPRRRPQGERGGRSGGR